MAKNLTNKPLKGSSLNASSGVFDTISANSILVSDDTLNDLIDGAQLAGVTIIDSELVNTIIGINGPSEGYFTSIVSQNDIIFNSIDNTSSFNWNSNTGILTIDGTLSVSGCSTLGNLQLCGNTISAINLNGDINLNPNNVGTLRVNAPVVVLTTNGNFAANILNGQFNVLSSNTFNFTSISSGSTQSTFSDQLFSLKNGNFTVLTDTDRTTKGISSILQTLGNTFVTASTISNLRIGDSVSISSGGLSGTFSVVSLVNNAQFGISSGSTLGNTSSGTFIKTPNNSITLGASDKVIIPETIPLSFGTHGSLSILGTGNNLVLDSLNLLVNNTNVLFKDSNPLLSNTLSNLGDLTDRGIQFNYYDTTDKLGWFGWKKSTSKFTFLKDVTNTGKVFTGTLGEIELGNTVIQNLTFQTGGSIDLACGSMANIRVISPCSTSGILVNGNLNVNGKVTTNHPGDYIYTIGTEQFLTGTISNTASIGTLQVTTTQPHYLQPGESVTLGNSNSIPFVDGGYAVNSTVSSTAFTVTTGFQVTSGTVSIFGGNLKEHQGKDIGLRLNYWSTVGNTGVTSGSSNSRVAFFGRLNDSERFVYYNNATISNNVVTSGVLGDIQINELFPNKISSFELTGTLSGGNSLIVGSNFQISGGSINSTPIGASIPSTGVFTDLNTANFTTGNINIQNSLTISPESLVVTSGSTIHNPSLAKTTTFISSTLTNSSSCGFLSTAGAQQGQVKKLVYLGNTSGTFQYAVLFTSGTLITPNPLNEALATKILFKRSGQSCELTFGNGSWFLSSGNGGYIS